MDDSRIRIAITQGDTNGVGYEVIFKALLDPTILEMCTPIIYGNPKVAAYHRKSNELSINYSTIHNAEDAQEDRINLLVCDDQDIKVDLGQSTPEAGQQALKALEAAIRDWKEELVDVVVTAPINKHSIQGEGFHFPGHTEYIQACVGDGAEALMILLNERIRVALVTTHLPLRQVADAITEENILQKLRIFNHTLQRDFELTRPRIAVLSLNPHAGDDGLLGQEEQTVIMPAMKKGEEEGIRSFGPYPSDGFFGARNYEHFDGVLAMYHDQGLSGFKAIAMDDGVNLTAGLPIVRTSPDHGTAYDIAGQNRADENSFRQALYTAIDVWRNRNAYDEAHESPLEKLYHDRREDERRPHRPE